MSLQWGGRFGTGPDESLRSLNDSLSFDRRLWREDIRGSIAHATMLGERGILKPEESSAIVDALSAIAEELTTGVLRLPEDAEDVHSAVEGLLKERVGALAGKLHTARSRNDQVATDLRLYAREAADRIGDGLLAMQRTLLEISEREAGTLMPGYTHLQRAQPVVLAHHLLAYFWMFQRDRERLVQARKRANVCPLGAGALAGTTFDIDRMRTAELLGFDAPTPNSLDAVSDRDFVLDLLAACAIVGVHLSRMAEEIILWSTREFGFVELDDSLATGSSMMPQKKNPDIAELARAKSGRLFGNLMTLLTVMKGLPLAYNKDMQEDKECLFDSIDTLNLLLPAMNRTLATMRLDRDRMAATLEKDFSTVTDWADDLVRQGMTFRQAHEHVGKAVRAELERGEPLEAEGFDLSPQASVKRRVATGGTAPAEVRRQLEAARRFLAQEA